MNGATAGVCHTFQSTHRTPSEEPLHGLESQRTALYLSVGRKLTHYDIELRNAKLVKRDTITLPQNVQYVWPHPSGAFLYAACSNGSPDAGGDAHSAVALRVDSESGALKMQGYPVPLPSRPIHVTLDAAGTHMLVAYNKPSSVTVHRIEGDGAIGKQVRQQVEPETGIYAHQVKVAPSGRSVIVVARGNDAHGSTPEDPGALKVFSYEDGHLTPAATVAPGGGYGFGPRHLDFHPSRPWVYVSLERQNTLQMYRFEDDTLAPEPAYTKPTLADSAGMRARQRPGTIHVHPDGGYAYVANRASGTAVVDGQPLYIGGENNIAVYAIDQGSGEPRIVQHADTHGLVPRTFALDKTGSVLVAANSVAMLASEGGSVTPVSPSLAVFKVREDGKLEYVRQYYIEVGNETMFWMGIV
jgi:6-phosphogluconolactonase (cycloisomerase 2 family)